jgi:hypothetical protein
MGLVDFTLESVFACAMELACAPGVEADEEVAEAERTDLLLDRMTMALRLDEAGTTLEALCRFRAAAGPPAVRNALKRLAFALAGLQGNHACVEAGRILLEEGAWQLWEGMAEPQRAQLRHRLAEAAGIWAWAQRRRGRRGAFPGPVEFLANGWQLCNGRALRCPPADQAGPAGRKDRRRDIAKNPGPARPRDLPALLRLAKEILKRMNGGMTKDQAALDYAHNQEHVCRRYLRQLTRYRAVVLDWLGHRGNVLYPRASKRP